ncbi:transposase [Streptomyces sp. SCSIO 30461]|uniref:transposase n=1 Tax=Streptomyces sp. SCSIO 30461 TaxID=3118085 RepID=UPI0030D57884
MGRGPGPLRAAHVPDSVGFATKPRLAERMIARIVPDLPEGRVWVAADEVYGRDGSSRAFLEENHLPYAVNAQANHTVLPRPGWRHAAMQVERHTAEDDWVTLPAGPSRLDSRVWQWWVRRIPDPDPDPETAPETARDRRRGVGAVVHRPTATGDTHSA